MRIRGGLLLLLLTAALHAQTAPAPPGAHEGDLLAELRSDAPLARKVQVCGQLRQIGTVACVPVLAGLLGEEKLAHPARLALEPWPYPAVDEALRAAVGRLKGRCLAGVLLSLGARRDAGAVPLAVPLLADADPEVAAAAAWALGAIGGPAATAAIDQALLRQPTPALRDAALRCGLWERLRGADQPVAVRVAAQRGAALAPGGAPLVAAWLREPGEVEFQTAVGLVREVAGESATRLCAEVLPALSPARQVVLLAALGDRGDRAALGPVATVARSGQPPVRAAACRALAALGDAGVLPVLLEAAAAASPEVVAAAQGALLQLRGAEVDARLRELAAAPDAQGLAALTAVAARRAPGATAVLLKLARDGSPDARLVAAKALAETAGPADLPALLALLLQTDAPVERAVIAVCVLATDKAPVAEQLARAWPHATPTRKLNLLGALDVTGGVRALRALHDATRDPDVGVRDAAVRALCNQQVLDAAPELLDIARTAPDPDHRAQALRACLLLLGEADFPLPRRLELAEQVLALAARAEDRGRWLERVAALGSPRALELLRPCLDEPAVAEAAASAAVTLATKLLAGNLDSPGAAVVVQVLTAVEARSQRADTLAKAKELRERAGRLVAKP